MRIVVRLVLGVPMNRLIEIYKRFKRNYRNSNGGINLYPQFDNDLDTLIKWLGDEFYGIDEIVEEYLYLPLEERRKK